MVKALRQPSSSRNNAGTSINSDTYYSDDHSECQTVKDQRMRRELTPSTYDARTSINTDTDYSYDLSASQSMSG
jgi:hypothetical protein